MLVLLALWIIFFVLAVYFVNVWPNEHGMKRRLVGCSHCRVNSCIIDPVAIAGSHALHSIPAIIADTSCMPVVFKLVQVNAYVLD